ncbi:MAG: galactokinase [Nocardioidaceae bacterium]
MTQTPGQWSAPGRVNLIGEHLDYNGGPVLPIAIDRQTTVRAALRDDDIVALGSDAAPAGAEFPTSTNPGDVPGWASYVAGVVWALRAAGHHVPGLDLHIRSDVPLGAGLSSSAALECAVAVAIRDLADLEVDDLALALLAQRAENDYVGVPSGAMDQLASMCGVAGHALLIDSDRPTVRAVAADWTRHDLALVVVDTRVSHEHSGGGYASRRAECERAAALLGVDFLAQADREAAESLADPLLRRRARHVVSETARVHETVAAMAAGDWEAVGELFTESHASLRDDFEVSCPELDVAVVSAVDAGALGARMTGGGFGGSAIALVPAGLGDAVGAACAHAFSVRGYALPHGFTVSATDGAGLRSRRRRG